MSSSSLQTAIREAEIKNNELKEAAAAEYSEKAKAVRDAAKKVNLAFIELQSVPGILAKYYFALQQANDRVVAALMPERTSYTDAEMTSAKGVLDAFQAAATQFKEMEAVFSGASTAEPLLSVRGRLVVSVVAALLLVLGAILAALGTWMLSPVCTTVSYWCAFASFALAVVWLFAYFTVHRHSVPSFGTTKIGSDLQYVVFGGMAFLVLGLLIAGVLTGGLLEFLSTIPGARGLITFLIAIGTIAIAVILTLASVIMEASDTDALKERLSKGKEILTVLVGVLGTIVGFYFASNPEGSVASKMTVAVIDAPKSVEAGADFSVLAMTTGGELPYDSTPIITVGKGVEGEGSVNEQGVVKVKFKVAADVKSGAIPFVVGLRDKSGKTATSKSAINVVAKK